jgi:hypothetical protein
MKRTRPQPLAIVARHTIDVTGSKVYDVLINVSHSTSRPSIVPSSPHIARIMCNNYHGALLVADALNAGGLALYVEPGSVGE